MCEPGFQHLADTVIFNAAVKLQQQDERGRIRMEENVVSVSYGRQGAAVRRHSA
jgi:hypothetical protein